MRIELEYNSESFVKHKHPLEGADMIVCYVHNAPEPRPGTIIAKDGL